MSSATTKSGTWNDSAERRMKRIVWDESHLTSEPLPLRSRLCRWSSAGRMARSTSSEDGSPTARDLARLPVNIGSVSGSGVRLCLCVCVCRVCVTHARDVCCVLRCRGKPNSGEQIFTQLWSTSCGFIMQLGGAEGGVSPYQQHNESHNDMNSQVEHSNSKKKEWLAESEIASLGDGARWRDRHTEADRDKLDVFGPSYHQEFSNS